MLTSNQELKKFLVKVIIVFIPFLIIFFLVNRSEFLFYNYQNNLFINNLINEVINRYPDISKEEIISLLDNQEENTNNILEEYGIDLELDSLVLKNEEVIKTSIIINVFLLLIFILILVIFYFQYLKNHNRELSNITNYLESINEGNYKLEIDTNQEDYLSTLKNEIYKITVMLKEQASNSKNDKLALKTSLEDLSHQLKTPLTSISIMLDNISNVNIDSKTKQEFIKDIRREVLNISFFVNTILKLARFDANTITFSKTSFLISKLLQEAIKNVSMLADLKNIKIVVTGSNEYILGDFKWQVEAITNILKNCIEYSNSDSLITINYGENKLYSYIKIQDRGIGMDKEDLKNLFIRFYKGKNSKSDSVGIGLALAKTIIEHDNAYISVDSKKGEGTVFVIKYMK